MRPMRRSHRATVRGRIGHEQLAEELAVVVEVLGAQVHLQVPDGVGEHEAR